MKISKFLAVVVLSIFTAFSLIGCSKEQNEATSLPEGIIGTWEFTDSFVEPGFGTITLHMIYTFNANGSCAQRCYIDAAGTIQDDETVYATYTYNPPKLTITESYDGEVYQYAYNATISGNKLTLVLIEANGEVIDPDDRDTFIFYRK